MTPQQPLELLVQIKVEDSDAEHLDRTTRQLLRELHETDVESAALVTAGTAPEGTKSADPVTIGAISIAVLPIVFPKLIEFLQNWVMRGQGRTMKFKGKVNGQDVDFEGSPEDFQMIMSSVEGSQTPDSTPKA